jgi:hypothetical protein
MKLLPALDADGVLVVAGDLVDGVFGGAYYQHSGRVMRVDGVLLYVRVEWVKGKPEKFDNWVHSQAREWRVKR